MSYSFDVDIEIKNIETEISLVPKKAYNIVLDRKSPERISRSYYKAHYVGVFPECEEDFDSGSYPDVTNGTDVFLVSSEETCSLQSKGGLIVEGEKTTSTEVFYIFLATRFNKKRAFYQHEALRSIVEATDQGKAGGVMAQGDSLGTMGTTDRGRGDGPPSKISKKEKGGRKAKRSRKKRRVL